MISKYIGKPYKINIVTHCFQKRITLLAIRFLQNYKSRLKQINHTFGIDLD